MNKSDIIFSTKVNIEKSPFFISHTDKIFMFGSCFVDNIGTKLKEHKFNIETNPLGILFNPLSIKIIIERILNRKNFTNKDLIENDGIYNSFLLHSKFADLSSENFLQNVNSLLDKLYLQNANIICITFGTAWIYRLKCTNEVVCNCHKRPSKEFIRERLDVKTIVNEYKELFDRLIANNKDLKIIMTVSPIRHTKDGMHNNQISKSVLLLAEEELQKLYPQNVFYFPAYEILLDELRDYRFYAEDMVHPSPLAIEYIWQQFSNIFFSEETKKLNEEITKINQSIAHHPFNAESKSYQKFKDDLYTKIKELTKKYPYISF